MGEIAEVSDINTFLNNSRIEFLKRQQSSPIPIVHIVMGNEAADLDTMVSSIVYAFFRMSQVQIGSRDLFVPILNLNREELDLRPEARTVFTGAGIDTSNLLFIDQVDLSVFVQSNALNCILVDHNRLSEKQTHLQPCVCEVVDHHVDEGMYGQQTLHRRLIEPVGSTCTLVALLIEAQAPPFLRQLPVASLLLSAILLDTHNMDAVSAKGTPKDLRVIQLLNAVVQQDLAVMYQRLLSLRTDVAHLSTAQMLVRDAKYGVAGGVAFGISSMSVDLRVWTSKHPDLVAEMQLHCTREHLQLLILMTSFAKEHTAERQLLVFSPDPATLVRVVDALQAQGSALVLQPLPLPGVSADEPGPPFRCFQQLNLASSRKQVMPIVVALLSRL